MASLVVAGATSAPAQQPGTIAGRVSDAATGEPVASAQVVLRSANLQTLTGPDGTFRFRNLPIGTHVIDVVSIGYASKEVAVRVTSEETAAPLEIVLEARPVPVREVEARAEAQYRDPRLAGFWRRKERSRGYFFTREEIQRRGPVRLTDLFQGLPQARIVSTDGSGIGRILSFGRNIIDGGACAAAVYLDGRPFHMSEFGMDEIHPEQMAAIEVYPGSAWIPAEFNRTGVTDPREGESARDQANVRGDARCGLVLLWSRQ